MSPREGTAREGAGLGRMLFGRLIRAQGGAGKLYRVRSWRRRGELLVLVLYPRVSAYAIFFFFFGLCV